MINKIIIVCSINWLFMEMCRKRILNFEFFFFYSLNMPHDDDNKCSEFRGSQSKQNIMSRMLDHNTHPWSWSNCSKHFVSEFLE